MGSTDNYLRWTEIKGQLESIVNEGDIFSERLRTADPETKEFQKVQAQTKKYLQGVAEVSHYSGLPSNINQTIERMEGFGEKLQRILSSRLEHYSSLESAITAEIAAWEIEPEEPLGKRILDNCAKYNGVKQLDQSLINIHMEPNQFYCDLSELAFIVDSQTLDQFKDSYAAASSEKELKAAKKSFDKEFWSRSADVRKKLRKKYGKGFFQRNYPKIIAIDPLSEFTDLYTEMRTISEQFPTLLESKAEIEVEREQVEEDISNLKQREAELDPVYIGFVLLPVREEKGFADSGTIYFGRNIELYQQRREELQKLKQEKKKEVAYLMGEKVGELRAQVASYHCLYLPEESELKEQQQEISQLRKCLKAISHDGLQQSLEEVEESLDQLAGLHLRKNELPSELLVSLSAKTPHQAITDFAYRAARVANNGELREFCQLVAGEIGPATFNDRITQAKGVNLEHLKGMDTLVYTHLKGGVEMLGV